MVKLIAVKYGKRKYPSEIHPQIEELAAHLDKESIKVTEGMEYSLHTEYCYLSRKMNSKILNNLPILRDSHKSYVPQLWYSKEWVNQFHQFIIELTKNHPAPKIIEIHPPFKDYCESIEKFLTLYRSFEEKIMETFKDVNILLENRCGTRYRGGKFLISKTEDLVELSKQIDNQGLKLRIALDPPQLITGNNINLHKIGEKDIIHTLKPLREIRHNIKALHLWGKKIGKTGKFTAHVGDLNTFFSNNQKLKNLFLEQLKEIFNDNIPRYFVPEVNGSVDDLHSIVNDMLGTGLKFT